MLGALLFLMTAFNTPSGVQVVGTVNSLLDPLPISTWKRVWLANPIDLSSNNLSQMGVTAIFSINLSTSLQNGVIEITFPSGFILTSVAGASGQLVQQALTATAGTDITITIAGITNPSATGPYGPFAIRTRTLTNGQIIDANLNFASVYITTAVGSLAQLAVGLASGSTATVNSSGNTLTLQFLISKDLWKYDLFRIKASQYWTVSPSVTCTSVDYSNRVNNFNGTSLTNVHFLDCATSAKVLGQSQYVYIYGLAVDQIDVSVDDNRYVSLTIGPLTSPDRSYPSSTYQWTVETMRFGTRTTLEIATVSSGPTINPGTITSLSWRPTTIPLDFNVVSGFQTFTDTTFTVANSVPAGGSIVITYTDTVSISAWSGVTCYILTYLSATATCTATSSSILTLSNLPLIAGGIQVAVRAYSRFSASTTAMVSTIYTYDSALNPIDRGTNLGGVTIVSTSTAKLASDFTVDFYDSTHGTAKNLAAGTGDTSLYIHMKITAASPADFVSTTSISVYCPLATQGSDFAFYIPTNNRVDEWKKDSQAMNAGQTVFNSGGTPNGSTVSVATGSGTSPGTIQFSLGANMLPVAYLSASIRVTSDSIVLPYIVNNPATAYECGVQIKDTTGVRVTQRFAKQFTISPQAWTTGSFTYFCTANINGAPVRFDLKPAVIGMRTALKTTYYIEFELSQYPALHGSALNEGDPYPVQTSLSLISASMTVHSGGANIVWNRLTGFGTVITPTAGMQVYFPVGVSTLATATAKIRSFYFQEVDQRIKFLTHESGSLTYVSLTAGFTAFPVGNVAPATIYNGDTVPAAGLTLNIRVTNALTADSWAYFVFPAGFTWTSGKSVLSMGTTPFKASYFFTSTKPKFAFPGVLVQQSTTTGQLYAVASKLVTIYGLRYSIGELTTYSIAVASANQAGTLSAACNNASGSGIFTSSAQAGAITALTVTPNSVLAQGPGGVDITHTLSFTLTHGIDVGGSIVLAIHSNWSITTCTICTVTGLTDQSATTTVGCTFTGNIFTIKNFADFSTARSTPVTVKIMHLLPPSSASSSGYQFVTSLVTYTAAGLRIDYFTATPVYSSNVIVATPLSTGKTTFYAKQTFPQNAGLLLVDLYLKFSLPHNVPACGSISVASPLTWRLPADSKNYCFMTGVTYRTCALGASGLSMTLDSNYVAGTQVELFCESAVDNPNAAGTSATGFKVTSSWFGAVIDSDGSSISVQQLFTASATFNTTLTTSTAGQIIIDPKNVCELSTYTFVFNSLLDLSVGRQLWVQFPADYDYYLGAAEALYSNDPGAYYMPCSIAAQSAISCVVDHRFLVVSFSQTIPSGSDIRLTVSNIMNPNVAQTGYFRLFLVEGGNALAASTGFAQLKFTSAAALIDIRSTSVANPYFSAKSDYTFRAYMYLTVDLNSEIHILFPPEFVLTRTALDSVSCSTSWVDDTNAIVSHDPQSWNSATTCAISGNRLILAPPGANVVFSANTIVSLTYNSILNPEFGQTRTAYSGATWDFDAYDTDVWPVYPFWTSKFQLFVYDRSDATKSYKARSYSNLHAAYIGLESAHKRLLVNGYNPQDKSKRVVLWAGSQSADLYITTESALYPCQSQSLLFTPKLAGSTATDKITFTSTWDQFTMFQDETKIAFRVAAALDTPKGLYYVQWGLTEVQQNGVLSTPYDLPAQTLIEIVPAVKGKFKFTIASIPQVQVGVLSLPIAVETTNSPQTDVSVTIGIVNEPANISISPSSLKFLQDINSLTFQIFVSTDYDMLIGSTFYLSLNITGTNAYLYTIDSPVQVNIIEATLLTDGAITGLGVTTPTRTTVKFTPTANQAGIVYYFLAAKGSTFPKFDELKARVQEEYADKMAILYHNKTFMVNETGDVMTQPYSYETWSDFERRLYASHIQSSWVGSVIVSPLTSLQTVAVDWLWAATAYQLLAYFDNMKPDTVGSSPFVENFTTAASADCQPFTLTFQGLVDNTLFPTVNYAVAEIAGVNPMRVVEKSRTVARRLDTATTVASTSFSSILLQNRFTETPDPSTLLTFSDNTMADLRQSLKARSVTNALTTMSLDTVPSRFVPQWKTLPSLGQVTSSSVSVNYATYLYGETCCVALASDSTYPTGEQMMLGLDPANQVVPHACMSNDLTLTFNSLTIYGLGAASRYYVFCTSTDTYPVFPSQLLYADINHMVYLTATTLGISDITPGDISAAAALALGLMIVLGF